VSSSGPPHLENQPPVTTNGVYGKFSTRRALQIEDPLSRTYKKRLLTLLDARLTWLMSLYVYLFTQNAPHTSQVEAVSVYKLDWECDS